MSWHTPSSGPATAGNIFWKSLLEWCSAYSYSSQLRQCLQISSLSSLFLIGEQPKVTRSHVRGLGWLLNDRNSMTCKKYLNGMCCVCWCIVAYSNFASVWPGKFHKTLQPRQRVHGLLSADLLGSVLALARHSRQFCLSSVCQTADCHQLSLGLL